MKTANELSERAKEVSRLANLRLASPHVVAELHDLAAVAQEKDGNVNRANEHRNAAHYWRAKRYA